jgi:phosphomannomutase
MDGEDALGLRGKRIVVADLDGTLAESKLPIDSEMKEIILRLLQQKKMAVIGGGMYSLFQKQLAVPLGNDPVLSNLYLFPTNATTMYSYNGYGWDAIYVENLEEVEKNRICSAFSMALEDVGFAKPETVYGAQVEDRGTQVTFSALGQDAPIDVKKVWDPDMIKRKAIKARLDWYLKNEFNVVLGGMTSIDVMRKGIDKAYGIKKIMEKISCTTSDMLFLGDKLEEGGNDYPVKGTGVMCINVGAVEDTKKILRSCLL